LLLILEVPTDTGAVELGLDCLPRYLQDLPVIERTDFARV
jgi:hypothetical protein